MLFFIALCFKINVDCSHKLYIIGGTKANNGTKEYKMVLAVWFLSITLSNGNVVDIPFRDKVDCEWNKSQYDLNKEYVVKTKCVKGLAEYK